MQSQLAPADLTLARMRELLSNQTSWHRSLWQIGTLTSIEEIIEAATATWGGSITTDQALADLKSSAVRHIRRDAGLGPDVVRNRICDLIASVPPKPSPAGTLQLEELQQHVDRVRADYLVNWSEHVAKNLLSDASVEVAARLIVAHLLDEGFHKAHLHGWLLNVKEPLAVALDTGHEMLRSGTRDFELLLAIKTVDGTVRAALEPIAVAGVDYTAAFDSAANASAHSGGRAPELAIRLTYSARDPHTAVTLALGWAQRLENRAAVGLGKAGVEFDERVVDVTTRKIRELREESRPLALPTIRRNPAYLTNFNESADQARIDDALGMLAANRSRATPTGIASIWATVEALLGLPRAKGVEAADRLADIVTCSFPRAEVWDLAKRWERDGGTDPLAVELRGLSTNLDKTAAMLNSLAVGNVPSFDHPKEIAAVNRATQLIADPVEVLGRIRDYYVTTFRRLYYQRNFIMHAGKLDSVSLPATSRTAPPLVAAGIDRIVNASLTDSLTPHGLAARAKLELSLLGTSGARPLHDLLA